MSFSPRPVVPVGRRETPAFVSRSDGSCGVEDLSLAVYPPDPRGERLREVRTGVPREAIGSIDVSVDPETGSLVSAPSPVWVKLGEPLRVEVAGAVLEVTAEMLRAAVVSFAGEVPVGADPSPAQAGPVLPHPVLGWVGAVEMRGDELWGLVRWVTPRPVPLSFVLETAPAVRLLCAYPRRYMLRVGDPVTWRGIDMTVASFCGEQRGSRVVRSTWDDGYGSESLTLESELTPREDERHLSLGDAARLAGISVVELSGLERGSHTLDDAEWERLTALVDEARRALPNR